MCIIPPLSLLFNYVSIPFKFYFNGSLGRIFLENYSFSIEYIYVCMEYFELVNAAYVTNGRGRVCTRDEYHGARDFVRFIQRGTGGDV